MNPGDLKHRITFQQLTTVANANGFGEESWADWKTVWAKVENLSAREYWAAKAMQAENTLKFTVRYLSGVLPSMRIIFAGKPYNIETIDDVQLSHTYLEIKASEVFSSG